MNFLMFIWISGFLDLYIYIYIYIYIYTGAGVVGAGAWLICCDGVSRWFPSQ